jgi:hypothetical protein
MVCFAGLFSAIAPAPICAQSVVRTNALCAHAQLLPQVTPKPKKPAPAKPAKPQAEKPPERTSVHAVVTEADTGKPINQARLTLRFREPGSKTKLKLPKMISYSAKTNSQGRYKFTDIPKGTILLLVTADRHQSFGKEIELEEDNQVVEVKLRKPQPLL